MQCVLTFIVHGLKAELFHDTLCSVFSGYSEFSIHKRATRKGIVFFLCLELRDLTDLKDVLTLIDLMDIKPPIQIKLQEEKDDEEWTDY